MRGGCRTVKKLCAYSGTSFYTSKRTILGELYLEIKGFCLKSMTNIISQKAVSVFTTEYRFLDIENACIDFLDAGE